MYASHVGWFRRSEASRGLDTACASVNRCYASQKTCGEKNKTPDEIYETRRMPRVISFHAWQEVFDTYHFHRYLFNSMIAGIGSAILAIGISLPGAYIFARKTFRFRELLFYIIVGTLIFPFILLIVPIAIFWIRIGLFDTFLGLWLAFQIIAIPYSMWICGAPSRSYHGISKRQPWSMAVCSSRRFTASCSHWPSR